MANNTNGFTARTLCAKKFPVRNPDDRTFCRQKHFISDCFCLCYFVVVAVAKPQKGKRIFTAN